MAYRHKQKALTDNNASKCKDSDQSFTNNSSGPLHPTIPEGSTHPTESTVDAVQPSFICQKKMNCASVDNLRLLGLHQQNQMTDPRPSHDSIDYYRSNKLWHPSDKLSHGSRPCRNQQSPC